MYVWKDIHMHIHICLIRIYIATDNSHPLAWYFCEASNEQSNVTKDATKDDDDERRRATTRSTQTTRRRMQPWDSAAHRGRRTRARRIIGAERRERWRNLGFKGGEFVEAINVLFFLMFFHVLFIFLWFFRKSLVQKTKNLRQNKQGKTCSGPAIRCHKTRKKQLLLLRWMVGSLEVRRKMGFSALFFGHALIPPNPRKTPKHRVYDV